MRADHVYRTYLVALARSFARGGYFGSCARYLHDLRAAMQARDTAFYAVDSAQWEKSAAPTFTTVQQDGSVPDQGRTACESAQPEAPALRPSFTRTE